VSLIQGLYPIESGEVSFMHIGRKACNSVVLMRPRLQILLDGQNIVEIDPTHLRSQLAVVAQEPRLFNTTLRGNIEVRYLFGCLGCRLAQD
jgi:ABC-type multidrug transport system fused ATPase/permease subunit